MDVFEKIMRTIDGRVPRSLRSRRHSLASCQPSIVKTFSALESSVRYKNSIFHFFYVVRLICTRFLKISPGMDSNIRYNMVCFVNDAGHDKFSSYVMFQRQYWSVYNPLSITV